MYTHTHTHTHHTHTYISKYMYILYSLRHNDKFRNIETG